MNQRMQPMTRRKFPNTARLVLSGALVATGLSGLRRPFAPLYLREVRQGPAGLHNAVIAALPPAEPQDRGLRLLRNSTRTGWLNPYLPA